VPASPEETFAFFADAANLERITPPLLQFQVLTPLPIEMRAGALIEYRLRLFGVPFRWRTRITQWEPSRRFVDFQERGPYLLWEHEHTLEPAPEGTLMHDRVRYAVPGGPLEPLAHALFVGPQVRRIFDYRAEQIRRVFGGEAPRSLE